MIQFKRLFKLGEKEVLKLVEYDEDIITAPQWVPIWRLWSPSGLFTVFGPHFLSLQFLVPIFFHIPNFSISDYSVNNSPPPFFSFYFKDFKLIPQTNQFVKNAHFWSPLTPPNICCSAKFNSEMIFNNIFLSNSIQKIIHFPVFNQIQFKNLFIF